MLFCVLFVFYCACVRVLECVCLFVVVCVLSVCVCYVLFRASLWVVII